MLCSSVPLAMPYSSEAERRTLQPKEVRMPPKRAEERQEVRSFTFRMPKDVFDDLAAVARSRGVDVSGLLNWMLAEFRPMLLKKRAEHEKAMLEAVTSREWEKMEPPEALRTLRDLLGKLQDEYAALSQQVLGKGERRAG